MDTRRKAADRTGLPPSRCWAACCSPSPGAVTTRRRRRRRRSPRPPCRRRPLAPDRPARAGGRATRSAGAALAVKISNSTDARPQVGLNQADIVIEERVEGITRLLAIFHSTPSAPVGPIRSARDTDIDLLAPLGHPVFVWGGANEGVAARVAAADVVSFNVDPDAAEDKYRDDTRVAPDNLFIDSTDAFWAKAGDASPAQPPIPVGTANGTPTGPAPTTTVPTTTPPPTTAPEATLPGTPTPAVSVDYGGTQADFVWDAERRAGPVSRTARRTSVADGTVLAPTNVVLLVTPYGRRPSDRELARSRSRRARATPRSSSGATRSDATWSRPTATDPYTLTDDATGEPLILPPGRTWVGLPESGVTRLDQAQADRTGLPDPCRSAERPLVHSGHGRLHRTSDGHVPRQAGPGRDAQGRRDHGRRRPRAGQDRRGRRRHRRHGPRAGALRHPPRRRRGPHERSRDDRGHQGRRHHPGHGQGPHRPLRRGPDPRRPSASTTSTSPRCSPRPTRPTTSTSGPSPSRSCAAPPTSARRCAASARAPRMIRSKGEAGTGNIVEAVRHLRSILGDIRKITQADSAELFDWAKQLQAPAPARAGDRRDRPAARCRCSAPAASPRRPTPRWSCSSGAEAVFVGSGIFKSANPPLRGQGHRRGHHATSATPTSWPR